MDMRASILRFLFSPERASAARTLDVSNWFAGDLTWSQAINNLIGTFVATIAAVAAAGFLVGAMLLVIGSVNTEQQNFGKKLMIGSLIGMGVALSAKAIFNTVLYFLYG